MFKCPFVIITGLLSSFRKVRWFVVGLTIIAISIIFTAFLLFLEKQYIQFLLQ